MGDVARFERVGGHPALDFVNTLGGLPERPDDEYLHGYGDLLTWAKGGGLLDPDADAALRRAADEDPAGADGALATALRLRGSLDAVLRTHLDDGPARAPDLREDLNVLGQTYTRALAHAELHPGQTPRAHPEGGAYDWAWPGAPAPGTPARDVLERPLWPLAEQAVDLLRTGPLDRLARCGRCRWLFLDTSRNRSRRWCSMNSCGAIIKMRRYRATSRP